MKAAYPRKIKSGSTHHLSVRVVCPKPLLRSGTSIEDMKDLHDMRGTSQDSVAALRLSTCGAIAVGSRHGRQDRHVRRTVSAHQFPGPRPGVPRRRTRGEILARLLAWQNSVSCVDVFWCVAGKAPVVSMPGNSHEDPARCLSDSRRGHILRLRAGLGT